MKGAEHRTEFDRLAASGLSDRQIGERFDLHSLQVWRVRNPERHREHLRRDNAKRNVAKRAWDLANHIPCASCGGRTGHTPGANRNPGSRPKGEGLCWGCHAAARSSRRAEQGHRIERWWAQGLTLREIAQELGWSRGSVGVEISRLRRKGFDLPYRYRMQDGKRVAG